MVGEIRDSLYANVTDEKSKDAFCGKPLKPLFLLFVQVWFPCAIQGKIHKNSFWWPKGKYRNTKTLDFYPLNQWPQRYLDFAQTWIRHEMNFKVLKTDI